jgi:hypothetical protein
MRRSSLQVWVSKTKQSNLVPNTKGRVRNRGDGGFTDPRAKGQAPRSNRQTGRRQCDYRQRNDFNGAGTSLSDGRARGGFHYGKVEKFYLFKWQHILEILIDPNQGHIHIQTSQTSLCRDKPKTRWPKPQPTHDALGRDTSNTSNTSTTRRTQDDAADAAANMRCVES